MILHHWRKLLGERAILLPCPPRCKGPRFPNWVDWSAADMEEAEAMGKFEGANIAALLGQRTQLLALDFDDGNALDLFLSLNGPLLGTLIIRGQRGAKLIIRAGLPPPVQGKDVKFGAKTVAEILTGNAMVAGVHPSGCEYINNGSRAMEVDWDRINWPEDWRLPGQPRNPHSQRWIVLPSLEEPALLPAAEEIFQRIAPTKTLFLRGGRVVEVIEGESGEPILSLISPAGFCSRLENYGTPMKWVSGGKDAQALLKPTACSRDLAEKLLAARQAQCLPRITSILTGPVAVEAQEELKILGDGFHECGNRGVLIQRTVFPTEMTLKECRIVIDEVLTDFRFVTDSDRARSVAFLFSPAIKAGQMLSGAFPLHVVEATESQTGKGYFCALVTAVYGERLALVGQRHGGVGGFDESLSGRLIEGRPFIMFDNIRGRIDSTYLEMILTAPSSVPCRIPHRGEVSVDVSGFTFSLTSNGIETTRDLANRANVIRLRKREQTPFTAYDEGDICEHIRTNRGRFIGAILTVVAEWVRRGKPLSDDLRGPGAFRQWWQAADYICREILDLSSPLDGLREAAERTANPGLQWLRNVCLALETDRRLHEEISATGLVELCQEHAISIPGAPTDGGGAEKIVGGLMGRLFKEGEAHELDDWRVVRVQREVRRDDGRGLRTQKLYTIEKQKNDQKESPPKPR